MANLFAGSSIPNFVPATTVTILAFLEKVPALSSDLVDDRDNNGSLVISQWGCHVTVNRSVNELAKVDGSRHVPVLLPATAADVCIRRNVTVGHRCWPLVRHSNERSDIVEFRRKHIQYRQVAFRRNILQREGAAGEIIAAGSARISSRIHLVFVVSCCCWMACFVVWFRVQILFCCDASSLAGLLKKVHRIGMMGTALLLLLLKVDTFC
jgi:hypothetical protein